MHSPGTSPLVAGDHQPGEAEVVLGDLDLGRLGVVADQGQHVGLGLGERRPGRRAVADRTGAGGLEAQRRSAA